MHVRVGSDDDKLCFGVHFGTRWRGLELRWVYIELAACGEIPVCAQSPALSKRAYARGRGVFTPGTLEGRGGGSVCTKDGEL